MDLTDKEQAIVRGGIAAAALLDSDAFVSTIKGLASELFARFVETAPTAPEAREAIYNQYQGLMAIEHALRGSVQAMEEIQRKLDAPEETTDELPY